MPSKKKPTDGVFLLPEGDLKRKRNPQLILLLLLFFGLLGMGLINLYSASLGAGYFGSQLRNLTITLSAFVLFGWVIPIRYVNDYAYWFLAFVSLLLLVVFLTGRIAGGAQRWILLGPFSFQPSEFAKLSVVLTVARFFASNRQEAPYTIRDLIPLASSVGIIFVLIFAQPDFGTAGACALIAVCQLAFIRINLRSIGLVLLSIPIALAVLWIRILMPYQKLRVLNFINPEHDPQNSGYQSLQSLIAVGNGGLFGKGFTQGTQAHLRFLPERHTDFIFSVFAEEWGLVGVLLLLALYVFIIARCLWIAANAKDTYSRLLAGAISMSLFVYVMVNGGMITGMLPVVGVPLPLVSYGGTSVVSLLAGFGVLISIHAHRRNPGAS